MPKLSTPHLAEVMQKFAAMPPEDQRQCLIDLEAFIAKERQKDWTPPVGVPVGAPADPKRATTPREAFDVVCDMENDLTAIESLAHAVHIMSTAEGGLDPYRDVMALQQLAFSITDHVQRVEERRGRLFDALHWSLSAGAATEAAKPATKPAAPDLSKLSMLDLLCIYDACERSSDAVASIINMPRCREGLEDFLDHHITRHADDLQRAVIDEAEARKPATRDEAEWRAGMLARWHVEARDLSLAQVALANAMAFDEEGEAA